MLLISESSGAFNDTRTLIKSTDGDSPAGDKDADARADTEDSDDEAKRKLKRQRRQRTHFTSQQLQGIFVYSFIFLGT